MTIINMNTKNVYESQIDLALDAKQGITHCGLIDSDGRIIVDEWYDPATAHETHETPAEFAAAIFRLAKGWK